jgi:ParB family chromosome partitioning protein
MGAIERLKASFRRQQAANRDDKASSGATSSKKHEGERMTTSATVESVVKHSGEKEKAEKRRALGRGLDSLLPGPRMVVTGVHPGEATPGGDGGARAAAPAPPADRPQIPPLRVAQGQNDKPEGEGSVAAIQPAAEPAAHAGFETHAATHLSPSRTLPTPTEPAQPEGTAILAQAESRVLGSLVMNLNLADIDKNPFQTRYVHSDDALLELAESIKTSGVVQPILVRPAEEDGRYILILGERRIHASKLAGKTTIPAIVRLVSQQQAAEMTIIENLQRQDLSPLEQAQAFRVLSEEFKLTQAQIGERVGLSRESVANYMRLLRLPRPVLDLLAERKIRFAEAKELLKLQDDEQITKAARLAVEKGMSFEQVEKLVLQMSGLLNPFQGMPGAERKQSGARWVDPNVRSAQMELERLLGVKVKIRDRKGKGKIVIEYHTVDDYERVVGMLRGK